MGRASVILESLPLPMLTDFAQKADEHGYDTVWKPEIIFSDTFVPSTAFALKTKRVHIGSCIAGLWGRSPVVTALSAYSLAELSGNRMILGLGTQARSYVEGWHGLSYDKPLTRARELITVIKKILAGEVVTFEGQTISDGQPGPIFQKLLAAWKQMAGIDFVAQAHEYARRLPQWEENA